MRPFIYGDDAKRIDWKSFAKTRTPFVKNYYQERIATVTLAPILSPTLAFGKKFDLLCKITATYARQTLDSGNLFQAITAEGDQIKHYPPTKNQGASHHFLHHLRQIDPRHTTTDLTRLPSILTTPSLLLLIGDFLDPVELMPLAQKHQIHLILIRDHFEEHPTHLGERDFIDLQSGKKRRFYFGKREMKQWRSGYERSEEALTSQLRRLRISYEKVVAK